MSMAAAQLGLSGGLIPETVRKAFEPNVGGLAAAEAYTRRLVAEHYENFSVISAFLPAALRQDFSNVYAFCRVADDLGDEVGDTGRSLELLAGFRQQTLDMYAGECTTPVFVALAETVGKFGIPQTPFLDLVSAFEQDQTVHRYETMEQVVDYCRRSADPVGRLVLYLSGYRDDARQGLSDCTCTALQLANFWQDVRRDIIERDRIYIPATWMRRHGVTEERIREGKFDLGFAALMRELLEDAERRFVEGRQLLGMIRPAMRGQIALFGMGGQAILGAIRRQGFDCLTRRPVLTKGQKLVLLVRALPYWIHGRLARERE